MRRVPPAASAAACALVVVVSAAFGPALAAPTIEAHDLTVRLSPAEARLDVVDKVTVRRDGGGKLQFSLGRGDLEIASATMDGQPATPERLAAFTDGSAMWEIDVPAGRSARVEMVLTYSGAVHAGTLPASAPPDSPAAPAAAIGPAGAALSDESRWTASDGHPARFTVTTWPVPGWEIVTQGTRTAPAAPDHPTVWTGKFPADGLSLVGGPWTVARRTVGGVEIGCFLGDASPAAADAVLAAAARHLAAYGARLGPFPFDRLDVVETSLATGRGIPGIAFVTKDTVGALVASAQQDGTTARRDFEREIVRGWWGHAVLLPAGDGAESGDWCAALTTYCTEVVATETDDPAAAAIVRDRACAEFARRITPTNDSPLRAFRPRASEADDAVVCGKGAMFFHALRREVGDDAFWSALRRLATERRGLRTSWADLRTEFEASSKRRLGEFFAQGLDRTGAPLLELTQTQIRTDGGRLRVTGVLRQRLGKRADGTPETPWRLAVPLVVEHLEGEEETVVDLTAEETAFALTVPSIPQRILVDPAHHVFRMPGESPSMTTRLLLPDLKSATSPERAQHVVEVLAAPQMKGRLAGSAEEAKARQFVMDELRLAGIEPSEVPVTFTVKHVDPARAALTQAGAKDVAGAVPLVASPETPEDGVSVVGSVTDEDADLAGRALVIDIGAGAERPLEFLRDVATLAVSRGAAALFVRMPAAADAPVADLWAFPETLREGVVRRLDEARASGGDGDAVRHAAITAARTGSDVELPLPTLAVPHGFQPAKDAILKVTVRFRKDEIRTANLVGRMKARGPRRTGTVVLGAHLDHLGTGFPGAGAASGVAALLEAVQVLSAQADLLARDVTVVVFGGEAWGLRGSRAFVAALPANHDVAAMIDADTAGRRGAGSVSVLGATAHPRLGRAVTTAVAQSLLDAGPEIDAAAYAWGGASWSFHRRGIPSVTLSVRGTSAPVPTGDTANEVDPANVARMGRAMALSALAVAGGW